MKNLFNILKKYKYYLCCFICILLILRIVYSRYNYLFIKNDKTFIPDIYSITFTILLISLLQYFRYMNKHYPNRDTMIKRFLRNNQEVKNTLSYIIEGYHSVYTSRFVDLDKYLKRFKAYVKFRYLTTTFYRAGFKFYYHLKRFNFERLTFKGFISSISLLLCALFMYYVVFVEPYYYNKFSYNHIGVVFIMLLINTILSSWANQFIDKEMQEEDEKFTVKFTEHRKELVQLKMELEALLMKITDKDGEIYKHNLNRLKETKELLIRIDDKLNRIKEKYGK